MAPVIFKAPNFTTLTGDASPPTLISASGRERSPEISRRASKIAPHIHLKKPFDDRKLSMSPALVRRNQTIFSSRTKLVSLSLLTVVIALTAGIVAVKFSRGGTKSTSTLWHPKTGDTWQIDLSKPLTNTSVDASVYEIDLFGNDAATIKTLHDLGRKVICYFSAGTYDVTLPDHAAFHAADVRDSVPESLSSDNERWLDTRSASVRAAMLARMDLAVKNGCDGVDPGFTDSYTSTTGFELTRKTALSYLQFLHSGAEARRLGIGLRNTEALVEEAVGMMGWSVNEGCEGKWNCGLYWPFVSAGKAVLHVVVVSVNTDSDVTEEGKTDFWCTGANTGGFSTILKREDLGSWMQKC